MLYQNSILWLDIFELVNHQLASHHNPVITCIWKSVNLGANFMYSMRKIHTAT